MPIELADREDLVIDWARCRDLHYLQALNTRVADALFPHRTAQTMFLKLYEEVGEMVRDPNDREEVADAIIMLMDHLSRIGGDVAVDVPMKLEKNLHRKWRIDPDTGVGYHVEDIK